MLPQQPQTATRFQAVHRVRLNPAETKITVSGELGHSPLDILSRGLWFC